MSLAYYIILRGSNAMHRYPELAESTWPPFPRPLTGSAISRIFKGITREQIESFLKHLTREFRKSCGRDASGRLFLALDSTSISSCSQALPQAEWGRNKDLVSLVPRYNSAPDSLSAPQRKYVEKFCDVRQGRASVNIKAVSDSLRLRLTGIRVLASSAISDPVECYRAHEERNHVEEAFNTLKSRLRCNRNRVHDPGCLGGSCWSR